MKKKIKFALYFIVVIIILLPIKAYARKGDCGYEGGISSGEAAGKTLMEYQEVCFVTGEPIVLEGTLLIKKSSRQDSVITTYTYNLKNVEKSATLTRILQYETKKQEKYNGQTVEETFLSRAPSETIKVGNVSYILRNYDFTHSNLIDSKPAIDYFAGNTWGKKTYQVGNGPGAGTVTVEATGKFYGYDQYWGSTEVAVFNYIIESEQNNGGAIDKWGGTATVSLSSSITKRLSYVENEPYQISFEGGYVETQYNNSVMKYTCTLPEFDAEGISTDNMITTKGSLQLETFPVQKRLPVADINHLRGHWAENDIKTLYSLEVFKGSGSTFNPERYMTRAEFTTAMVKAAKEVPEDPSLVNRMNRLRRPNRVFRGRGENEEEVVSPFIDVSTESIHFDQIKSAYDRGLISGKGSRMFAPSSRITVAEAITVFIRALGLEVLAPNPGAVTTFKDNDEIPHYARDAVYVAEKIGLIHGDDRGYLRPNESLTKGRAAALINRFINYMREGIKKDYRDGIINYY